MRQPADVPELGKDSTIFAVNGVGYRSPAGDLLAGPDAGDIRISLPFREIGVPSVTISPAPARWR